MDTVKAMKVVREAVKLLERALRGELSDRESERLDQLYRVLEHKGRKSR